MTPFRDRLVEEFGAASVQEGAPLAALTTFRVGGAADWLLQTRSAEETVRALRLAHEEGVAVTMLGGGSNILISDAGIRGLVIRTRGGDIGHAEEGSVQADAAVTINGLVRWCILHGAAGLEAWAGTPGTVGGAVFGNAHFGGRQIGSLIAQVGIVDRAGRTGALEAADMEFGYDRSRLQRTGEVLLWARFRVGRGDPPALRRRARESLAFRKRTQPLEAPSAGCVFQNPQLGRDHVPEGLPFSAGALVDRAGLKGTAVGGARVSPTHGNFIVNEGRATASDIRALIERCRLEVRERFGVELREEIVYLGEW
jgi:UDP-N-acetylmuramate dehydrogenase